MDFQISDNKYTSGDTTIYIRDRCYLTNPCQHSVKINDGKYELLGAREIIELFKKYNLEVPEHFRQYINRD